MSTFGSKLIALVLLGIFTPAIAATSVQPKRVLIIHSYPPGFDGGFGEKLRSELDTQLSGQLDVHESWLGSARLPSGGDDPAFADYLNSLFFDRSFDLVIAIGSPAARFLQRYRQELFPSTPELLTLVEQHQVAVSNAGANQVAVPYAGRDQTTIGNILRILPHTKSLVVVMGNSPIERHSIDDLTASARTFGSRLTVIPLNSIRTFDELLKRISTLAPQSAIYYELFFADINGSPTDQYTAFAKVYAVANAPLFSLMGGYFGQGIVGGPMIFFDDYARQTASVAARILSGEALASIKVPLIRAGKPKFDSRELTRWDINQSLLPPDSEIDYLKPNAWQQYRWQIVSAASLIILQALLILRLMYEHRRRRTAEVESHRRLFELARMNRRSAAGELSASIAHELNQPLTAILANADAAQVTVPSVTSAQDLRDLIADIKRDTLRASEVIKRLRRMVADVPFEPQELDLNEVIQETFEFLSHQARGHRTVLGTELASQAPRILGDRIQLQQIILNLVLNALDAMGNTKGRARKIFARTSLVDDLWAEVCLEDTGPGIPDDKLERIFEPFFTTKKDGMGMGLSIVRAIVESQGGRIWAENSGAGGAVFRFTLPLSKKDSPVTDSSSRKTARLATSRMPHHYPPRGGTAEHR
jgi:signal transduction histidine kinase